MAFQTQSTDLRVAAAVAQDPSHLVAGRADPEPTEGALGRFHELRGGDGPAVGGLRRGKRRGGGRARPHRVQRHAVRRGQRSGVGDAPRAVIEGMGLKGLRAADDHVLEFEGRHARRLHDRRENTGRAAFVRFLARAAEVGLTGEEADDDEEVTVDGVPAKQKPTPYETMRKALDATRYDAVRTMLSEFDGAPFADYTFTPAREDFVVVDAPPPPSRTPSEANALLAPAYQFL